NNQGINRAMLYKGYHDMRYVDSETKWLMLGYASVNLRDIIETRNKNMESFYDLLQSKFLWHGGLQPEILWPMPYADLFASGTLEMKKEKNSNGDI
ncbi:MAG TPA: hypothetical protein VKR58_13675, partial [Aquella sp.]|nr:hypothetical protein [Aquella sp.]